MIQLNNLTREEAIKKVSILVQAIKAEESTRFSLQLDWNDEEMKIRIGVE